MNRLLVLLASLAVFLTLSGCAHQDRGPTHDHAHPETRLPLFSDNPPGDLPAGWNPLIIMRTKKLTEYRLVSDRGRTVLHARAVAASSGLINHVSIDPLKQPWLKWQWKIEKLIKSADNTERTKEDSPVRIVLGFDGDKESLSFSDQMMFETAKLVTGHDVPFATLMYIWENKAPVGTVISNSRTGRIKKLVAASGPDGIAQWRDFTRNVVEDYQKAFGEKPGRLIGIGVMTDTDNTGETVEAWYGDIRMLPEQH
ncbi:MAG: hypothetical protein JWR25_690 [Noviherbaspirillum sp.]|jgi:hypothetical protein|nr:hypothetical protein [Noviherbaspirillum sp.]MDB5794311.1 hypothetical protein [Noviherbaspirillum sp.]